MKWPELVQFWCCCTRDWLIPACTMTSLVCWPSTVVSYATTCTASGAPAHPHRRTLTTRHCDSCLLLWGSSERRYLECQWGVASPSILRSHILSALVPCCFSLRVSPDTLRVPRP